MNAEAAATLGLKIGTPVTYRAGDQPNNALSFKCSKSRRNRIYRRDIRCRLWN